MIEPGSRGRLSCPRRTLRLSERKLPAHCRAQGYARAEHEPQPASFPGPLLFREWVRVEGRSWGERNAAGGSHQIPSVPSAHHSEDKPRRSHSEQAIPVHTEPEERRFEDFHFRHQRKPGEHVTPRRVAVRKPPPTDEDHRGASPSGGHASSCLGPSAWPPPSSRTPPGHDIREFVISDPNLVPSWPGFLEYKFP